MTSGYSIRYFIRVKVPYKVLQVNAGLATALCSGTWLAAPGPLDMALIGMMEIP